MIKRSIITWLVIVGLLIILSVFEIISYNVSISVFIATTIGIFSMILAFKNFNKEDKSFN